MDRQLKVFQTLNSYSELSPSDEGLHIIGKVHIFLMDESDTQLKFIQTALCNVHRQDL